MDRLTFTATGSVDGSTLSGVAHSYGTRTLRGARWIEFAAGAFSHTDVRAFLNHDTTLLLGRESNGTVRLDSRPDGLHYAIDLPDTTYANDLKALVARGDLTEMSFGVVPGAHTTSKADDGRTVVRYTAATLFDISPVSLPAFDTGTSVQLHSEETPMTNTIPEIMDAMQVAVDSGDNERFAGLEADLASAQATDANRARLETYRKVDTRFPSVIRATPKGDAGLDFAFDQYLRTGVPNADLTFAQTVGSTTGGGYTVPDTFLRRLVERRVSFGGFMNEAENITTSTGAPLTFPVLTPPVHTEADIAAEGAASAAGADMVFPSEITLGAYKYTSTGTGNVPLKVSSELLQDSEFDISALVSRVLGERIARKQAYDLIMGPGSSAPKGIAYGTAGTIEADIDGFAPLSSLVHALDPAYRFNAKWIMSDATAAIIEKLLDGASGTSGRPLLTSALNGIEHPANNYRLLGYPVVIDAAMPTMNVNDVIGIAFGDWKQAYMVRHVRDVQVLVNPYTTVGYVQFDAWARMDGQVVDSYAYVTGEGV